MRKFDWFLRQGPSCWRLPFAMLLMVAILVLVCAHFQHQARQRSVGNRLIERPTVEAPAVASSADTANR